MRIVNLVVDKYPPNCMECCAPCSKGRKHGRILDKYTKQRHENCTLILEEELYSTATLVTGQVVNRTDLNIIAEAYCINYQGHTFRQLEAAVNKCIEDERQNG